METINIKKKSRLIVKKGGENIVINLMDLALEEREHATISFLKWYVDEQVEEESNFNTIIGKINRAELNPAALYMLDDELLARVYVPAPTK